MNREQEFRIHRLKNGIILIGEEMDFVSSAAFAISVPVGSATDPPGLEGSATLLTEMLNKGAGAWNSRELSEQFENIGARRSQSSGVELSMFSGVMLGDYLAHALKIASTMILDPLLPGEELTSVQELALQELNALEDEPASKVMVELARRFYPYPFGRCQLGTAEGVRAVTIDSLRNYYRDQYLASGVIIGVAGKFDWNQVKNTVESCFGSWSGTKEILSPDPLSTNNVNFHIEQETAQLHIALAYPSVSFEHPDYYAAKVAVGVLSGGMAGRLFVEIREKRGLVYRVGASHSAAKNRAAIFCHAGTTPPNGEETLEVMLRELKRLKDGVEDEELRRAKADLKSRIIMQGELSSIRATSLVNDWWNLGRARTLREINEAIDRVSAGDVARYAADHQPAPLTLVTLGPKGLELPQ